MASENARMSTASGDRDELGSGVDMILGNNQGGENNGVRHIEKFPIRLNL